MPAQIEIEKMAKNLVQTIGNNKFECFDVRPLHCNFLLFTTKNDKNFHMLYNFDIIHGS